MYGYVTDSEESYLSETGKQVNTFSQLKDDQKMLFKMEGPNPINPFYDAELMDVSNNTVLVAREAKSSLTIFHGDSLYRKRIPFIEEHSLAEEIKADTDF
ncbi:hypothetical protein [Fodinibius salinus]|nr:hypothetical protein [Fodinibius salinus]